MSYHNNSSHFQGNQNHRNQLTFISEPQEENSILKKMMTTFISSVETRLQNQNDSLQILDNQIGKLEKMIADRESGIAKHTTTNPKEQVKAIELRREKVIEEKVKEKDEQEVTKGMSSNSTQTPTSHSKIVISSLFFLQHLRK